MGGMKNWLGPVLVALALTACGVGAFGYFYVCCDAAPADVAFLEERVGEPSAVSTNCAPGGLSCEVALIYLGSPKEFCEVVAVIIEHEAVPEGECDPGRVWRLMGQDVLWLVELTGDEVAVLAITTK